MHMHQVKDSLVNVQLSFTSNNNGEKRGEALYQRDGSPEILATNDLATASVEKVGQAQSACKPHNLQ